MLLIDHHAVARSGVWGTVAAGVLAEIVATRRRRGGGPPAGPSRDRGTKSILVLGIAGGIFGGAYLTARVPAVRVGANTWVTWALGVAILALGIGLRVWGVWSLGRWFRREVTIEPGQTVHTAGPYRFIRHPAYLGDLLIVFGLVLAWGSWAAAAAGAALALAGHLPRIAVEERELRTAFGDEYERYAGGRDRLVPGIW